MTTEKLSQSIQTGSPKMNKMKRWTTVWLSIRFEIRVSLVHCKNCIVFIWFSLNIPLKEISFDWMVMLNGLKKLS